MIPGARRIRRAALGGEAIDEPDEALVPLRGVAAVDHGIAALEHEADGVRSAAEPRDGAQHRLDDERVLVLRIDAVAAAAGVAIHYE